MRKSAGLRRLESGVAAFAVLVATEVYVGYNQTFGFSTFLIGVALPLGVGCVLFRRKDDRFLLFVFLGYFWSVVDDAPVNFDSIFTWPEVTRLNPVLPHLTLELLLHLATIGFMYLSVRQVSEGALRLRIGRLRIYILLAIAFLLSYFQNIPLRSVQSIAGSSWYQLDVIEHLGSVVVLSLALIGARNLRPLRGQTDQVTSYSEKGNR